MDDLIRRLKNSRKAEGQDRIYLHGEKEFELEEKYRKEGIPLYHKVYDDLKAISEESGSAIQLIANINLWTAKIRPGEVQSAHS